VRGGIGLYPYRVSAGIDPPLHFIAGISQKNIEVSFSPYPFLKEDMILPSPKKPSPVEERQFTEAFLSLYTHSGNRVVFSGSATSFRGPQIFPASLLPYLDHDPPRFTPDQRDFTTHIDEQTTMGLLMDPLQEERKLWEEKEEKILIPSNSGAPSFAITPIQRRGLRAAVETVFQKKETDFTEIPIENAHLRNQIKNYFTEDGKQFFLSPSSLESLVNCPFSYLFQRVLRCEAPEYEITITDPKWEGILLHEILRNIFQSFMEKDMPFPNERDVDYSLAEKAVTEIFKKAEDRGKAYVPPAWSAFFRSTVTQIKEFLKAEAENFQGYRVHALEKEYRRTLDNLETLVPRSIVLRGRIDRISYGEDGIIIVDYKRNRSPRRSELSPEEGEPRSFQLPFYGFLLKKEGSPLEGIMVYAFKKAQYQKISGTTLRGGKALLPWEDFERLVSFIPDQAKETVYKIEAGDFVISREEPNCTYCEIRGVCRNKYAVRNKD
jgi:RecB family exonuclease